MAISVNFYDEVIYVTSPTTTVTVQEVHDAIRDAEDTVDGIAFDEVIEESAVFNLGGGAYTAVSMEINANYYVEFWDGVVVGTVKDGNLVGGMDSRPVRAAVGSEDTAYQLGAQFGIQMEGTGDLSGIEAMLKQIKNLFFIQGI